MATILKRSENPHTGATWCRCCGDLNQSSRGVYLKRLRRKVKRAERQTWKREVGR